MSAESTSDDSVEIGSLFVPLDGTEWHERAISYGLLISEWFGSTLDLFFSLADIPPLTRHGEWRQRAHLSLDTAEQTRNRDASIINNGAIHEFGKILANDYLNEVTRRLEHYGVDITTDLSAGSPAHILSYKAQQAGDSMIVMYARPQNRIRRYVRKKMAEELLSVATVPVFMVNDDRNIDIRYIRIKPESVIVPLRVEGAMKVCLPYALAIAKKNSVPIQIVESNIEYRRNRREFDRAREYLSKVLEESPVEHSFRASRLGITNSLSAAHKSSPYSWIVMGSRMRYGFSRNFWPSVADNIRREVSCPVLAVPHAEVIPKREEQLKRWIDDWLAHQDASSLLVAEVATQANRRGWAQQITSIYASDDEDRPDSMRPPK